MTLKINYIKQTNEEIENEAIESLEKNFNKLAKESNSKYRITFKYGSPYLTQKTFFGLFENYSNHMVYLGYENKFVFVTELDETILEEIRDILDEIPELIEVELVKEE